MSIRRVGFDFRDEPPSHFRHLYANSRHGAAELLEESIEDAVRRVRRINHLSLNFKSKYDEKIIPCAESRGFRFFQRVDGMTQMVRCFNHEEHTCSMSADERIKALALARF